MDGRMDGRMDGWMDGWMSYTFFMRQGYLRVAF